MTDWQGRESLVEMVRDRVPKTPGVYIFYGDTDEILYVGKAIDLRQRVLSHLSLNPKSDGTRHSRLVYETRRFEWQTTPTELLALLREDELIKRDRPRYNVRQNEFLEYKYVELTTDEYPRLRMIDHSDDLKDRRVFGPYRDRYLVDHILQMVHHHLGLRSCPDPDPGDGCLEFELGHCAGPCRSSVTTLDYEEVVSSSATFLAGDDSKVVPRLQRAMEDAASRLDFEKAQRLKEHLEFCIRFAERQRFLRAFKERELTIVEECNPEYTYRFVRGRLIAHGQSNEAVASLTSNLEAASEGPEEDPRFLLDRANIVHNWLRRNTALSTFSFADSMIRDRPTGSTTPSG